MKRAALLVLLAALVTSAALLLAGNLSALPSEPQKQASRSTFLKGPPTETTESCDLSKFSVNLRPVLESADWKETARRRFVNAEGESILVGVSFTSEAENLLSRYAERIKLQKGPALIPDENGFIPFASVWVPVSLLCELSTQDEVRNLHEILKSPPPMLWVPEDIPAE